MSDPAAIPFHIAYPAPWSIKDDNVIDAAGDTVTCFDDEDAEEVIFWQGIVTAVNSHARIEQALRLARAS